MESARPLPDFRSPEFLLGHVRQITDFYHPACVDRERGGFFNEFRDDGRITDRETRHLVSTTRFIVNYAIAADLLGREEYREACAHGVRFLTEAHADREHGGYHWVLDGREPRDSAKHCYGHAFVLLAFAAAAKAGVAGVSARVAETWDLLEWRFFEPEAGLYADEASPDWSVLRPYRGQNANMHMCEAMLAAFEATGAARYLDRAELLARRICAELAGGARELVWEHYHTDWSIDWDYNKDDPKNLFRPYGHLPGHFTEWAKLLLVLERYRPADWLLPRARHLYETALARSADLENGGLHYSFGPDGTLHDLDKYHWVHCETIAAAAALAVRTGEERFWQDYDRLWAYSWRHLVDVERGGWYRVLAPDGRRYDDLKSPPAKTDYHALGAAYEILRVLGRAR
jgi:mannose/cellobiose epimerase-like protein (N-acyl-D-glucosamine 2-epimerase family)